MDTTRLFVTSVYITLCIMALFVSLTLGQSTPVLALQIA